MKKARLQFSEFRLRTYLCKKCGMHIEFFGNDPVVGKCCRTPIASLPLESDVWIETTKRVTPYQGQS